jgi:predicted ABC-type transport system involved in lysophospholipase L1 biosynthesis ATPase subunit
MEGLSMPDVLVEGTAVARRFRQGDRDVYALRPASFLVHSGDRIALLGPSGSGKSTLLHLMADLDIQSTGHLKWPALGPHGTLRPKHIGMVFQAPSLIPTLSAVENVEVPLRLAGGKPTPRDVAMRALEAVGLAAVADKLPDELSGGQAQRVALARAVALKPRLVLADEPTGQLDQPTARQAIEALLGSIDGTDAALVIATHDPLVAERMNVTWLMDHGQLRAPDMMVSK